MWWLNPLLVGLVLGVSGFAAAEEAMPPSLNDEPGADLERVVVEAPETAEDRVTRLENKVQALEQRITESAPDEASVPLTVFGYIDFGFFAPQGNGSGWVQDVGNLILPEYDGRYAWVFLGDILAPTVNSRGDAADLGDSPGSDRFDSVGSGGAPGFIVNEVNLGIRAGLGERLLATASINFVPRTGSEFDLGDYFNLDLAQLEWVIDDEAKYSLFVGKFDSVFGIEYKERRADDRFGVTPSLIARYTIGTQLGLKGRVKLLGDWLILAGSITNGSSTTEQFHFYNEIDTNSGKTLSGRASVRIPVGDFIDAAEGHTFEIGLSGEWGSQDRAANNSGQIWFAGVDLEYRTVDFALKAQWIRGGAPGDATQDVWELQLNDSGYVQVDYMLFPWLGALARVELRDAFVGLGAERAYLTKSWRFTGGVRAPINHHVVLKAEYLKNGEFGEVPEIDNDVLTVSGILRY